MSSSATLGRRIRRHSAHASGRTSLDRGAPAHAGCHESLPGARHVQADHSTIFWAELGSIVWLVVTGISGRRDRSVAVAATLVAVESAVFVANDRVCPLTPLAERFGASSGSVSDIWLPDVVARTIPYWTVPLVALGAVLHLGGMFVSRRSHAAR